MAMKEILIWFQCNGRKFMRVADNEATRDEIVGKLPVGRLLRVQYRVNLPRTTGA
jgi:hypothetical protein